MFSGLPVSQEQLFEPSTNRNNIRSRVKFSIISIIIVLVFLLILILSVTFIFVKKKQIIPSHSSTTTYTFSPKRTTTTAVIFTNAPTTSSATSELKPSECQLPLIPMYSSDKKTVVAGGKSPGSNVYELNKPIAIALDSKSNLFVADSGNFRVLKYTKNSSKGEIVLGNGTDRSPRTTKIIGLLVDKNDLLYTFQDSYYNNELTIWPSSSKNGTVILTKSGHIAGLAIDRNLDIYLAWAINVWIYLAPTYSDFKFKRIFGEPAISGTLPIGASSIYVNAKSDLFAIDMKNYRIRKTPFTDEYSETVVQKSTTLLAITGDCHNNLYTIDSNSSLIIYNSTGDVISTMFNAIDYPYDSNLWKQTYISTQKMLIPNNFASLFLDSKTGDLYVIMYGYDRITKYALN